MKVAVIMGSSSDWKIMQESCNMLDYFEIPYEKQVVSAHRTPKMMVQFASEARERGINIIIAGAGGASTFTRYGCIINDATSYWSAD